MSNLEDKLMLDVKTADSLIDSHQKYQATHPNMSEIDSIFIAKNLALAKNVKYDAMIKYAIQILVINNHAKEANILIDCL